MSKEKLRAQTIIPERWVPLACATELLDLRELIYTKLTPHMHKLEGSENASTDEIEQHAIKKDVQFIDAIEKLVLEEKYKPLWDKAKNHNHPLARDIIDIFFLDPLMPKISHSIFREHISKINEHLNAISNLCATDKTLDYHVRVAFEESIINFVRERPTLGFANHIPEFTFSSMRSFTQHFEEKLRTKEILKKTLSTSYKYDDLYKYTPLQPKEGSQEKTYLCSRTVDMMIHAYNKPNYKLACDLLSCFRSDLAPFKENLIRKAYNRTKAAKQNQNKKKV